MLLLCSNVCPVREGPAFVRKSKYPDTNRPEVLVHVEKQNQAFHGNHALPPMVVALEGLSEVRVPTIIIDNVQAARRAVEH